MIVIATRDELCLVPDTFNEPILITGVGASNVIKALQDIDRNTPIVNYGYCGSNVLPIGSTVVVGQSRLYHPSVEYKEPIYKLKGGTTPCYTSNDFVTHTDINQPVVFDMELAYIMALGFTNVQSIKVVSDNLSLNQYEQTIQENNNG